MSSNPSRTAAPLNVPSSPTPSDHETGPVTPLSHAEGGLVPPVARVVPRVENVHGEFRADDYFWLRDRTNPAVMAYLEAENRYAAAAMRHTEALQELESIPMSESKTHGESTIFQFRSGRRAVC